MSGVEFHHQDPEQPNTSRSEQNHALERVGANTADLVMKLYILALILVTGGFSSSARASDSASIAPWNKAVEERLPLAGTNRLEISRAFRDAPAGRVAGLNFLVENMPEADLQSLSAQFLLDQVNLAYDAWEKSPWHAQVSPELFLNDVLPYASLNEERESWRAKFRADCLPLIAGAKSPGEAAHLLNQKLFPFYQVKYNTARRRPDQAPSETIQTGVATCTGLAILLVDACRSVGVPARIAGTAMWSNMRGNHTWVEVWDNGWHFFGAAEPDPAGLDRGWFTGDAAKAQRDVPRHAIWATSFKRTENYFPLVWLPGDKSVPAVNVTDRYAAKTPAPVAGEGDAQLSVKVMDANGRRVVADVTVTEVNLPEKKFTGQSRGETADMNDFLSFKVSSTGKYRVVASLDGRREQTDVQMASPDQLMTMVLPEKPASPSNPTPVASEVIKPLEPKDAAALKKELGNYFTAKPERQEKWKFPKKLEKLLAQNEAGVRAVAWDAFRAAPIHATLKTNYDAKVAKFEQHTSPYTVKQVGTRPAKGWPLFIAMHGGGGAPKELNDSQWRHMQIYYKEHPEAGGYLYLALRAPNDTWNGFYDNYVYPLIDNLILQFRLFGDIDPDKVFIMGYSHGGYGAYAIGPKMPDRFAEIHASAAAGTDGETTAKTLRTTKFTAMVGEKDTMYDRHERNLRFQKEVETLRGNRTDIYPVTVTVIKGNGHTGLPDRNLIPTMYPSVRNPVPRELDWLQTDVVVRDFFWLRASQAGKGQEILASCNDNRFVVTANEKVSDVSVLMDSRLVDLSKPVSIELNGSTVTRKLAPGLKMFCETLARRGDPAYAFSAELQIAKNKSGQLQVQ